MKTKDIIFLKCYTRTAGGHTIACNWDNSSFCVIEHQQFSDDNTKPHEYRPAFPAFRISNSAETVDATLKAVATVYGYEYREVKFNDNTGIYR